MQPVLFRKGWTKCCITKLLVSRCKCTDPACHGKFVTSVRMPESGKACPQVATSSSRDGCLHSPVSESPVGLQAALTLSCLGFVMMSVMAGGDQHAVYSHLVAVSSTGFYSLNVLDKRERPGFYSAGCGAITLGIQMFSYFPAAPAEIAVLPWAAAYPYWQAGRHSYPPSHQAHQPLLFETWMDSLDTILLETMASPAGLEGVTAVISEPARLFPWENSCSSCWMLQLRPSVALPAGTLSLTFVLLIGRHSRSMVTCFLLLLPGTPAFTMLSWKLPILFQDRTSLWDLCWELWEVFSLHSLGTQTSHFYFLICLSEMKICLLLTALHELCSRFFQPIMNYIFSLQGVRHWRLGHFCSCTRVGRHEQTQVQNVTEMVKLPGGVIGLDVVSL